MQYEQAVTARFKGRRIVALCSYALAECDDRQIGDVMQAHPYPLARVDAEWQLSATAPLSGY
jgi:hypothetical protein